MSKQSNDADMDYTEQDLQTIEFLMTCAMRTKPENVTLEICKKQFSEGNVNFQTPGTGINMLMIAAEHRKTDIVKWLLEEKKADTCLKTLEDNTALHCAFSKEDNIEIIELLLSHGASLEVKNVNGDTPLDIAKEEDTYSKEQISKWKKGHDKESQSFGEQLQQFGEELIKIGGEILFGENESEKVKNSGNMDSEEYSEL